MTVMPSPSSVSYIQLRRICSAYGLPSTGPRATLERRIMLHEREAVDTDEEDKEEGEEQNEQEGEGAGVDDEEEGSNEMPVLTEDEDEGHDGKGKGKGSNTAKDALRLWGGKAATPSAKATVAVHGSSGGGWFNDPHREATEYVRHDGLASKLHRAHPLSLSFAPHPPPRPFSSLPASFLPSITGPSTQNARSLLYGCITHVASRAPPCTPCRQAVRVAVLQRGLDERDGFRCYL